MAESAAGLGNTLRGGEFAVKAMTHILDECESFSYNKKIGKWRNTK